MNTSKLRILPYLIAVALFAVTLQWMFTQPLGAQEADITEEAGLEEVIRRKKK